MIAVTRSKKPVVLERKEQDWLAALHRATTKAQKEDATNKYRHDRFMTNYSGHILRRRKTIARQETRVLPPLAPPETITSRSSLFEDC